VPSNSRRSASRNTSSPAANWPADHRDQIVGATLAGMVLVLLGYASGIGGGGGVAQATGGPAPGTLVVASSPTANGSAPDVIQATGGSGGSGDYGYGFGGGSGAGSAPGAGAWPSPSAESRAPDIVGGSPLASPSDSPSASPSGAPSSAASCSLLDCVTSVLTGTTGGLTCLLGSGPTGLPGLTGLTDPIGLTGVLSGVTAPVGSLTGSLTGPLTGGLLGGCPTPTPSATPNPSAP
jgi:hypothetical protein